MGQKNSTQSVVTLVDSDGILPLIISVGSGSKKIGTVDGSPVNWINLVVVVRVRSVAQPAAGTTELVTNSRTNLTMT